VCDSKDNNCDGNIDEAMSDVPCYTGPKSTSGVGVCKSGVQSCQNGQWAVCTGEVLPAATDDTCNNQDDDCDNQTDEEYVQAESTCGTGACASTGTVSCQGGELSDSCDPAKTDGTDCDDGFFNTVDDSCTLGVCAGVDKCADVICEASSQCHNAGICDILTGACNNPPKTDGADCNDGDDTTADDACTSGVCGGMQKCADVTCVASSQCHDAGTCEATTGVCSNPTKTDGSACDDGKGICADGVCTDHPFRGALLNLQQATGAYGGSNAEVQLVLADVNDQLGYAIVAFDVDQTGTILSTLQNALFGIQQSEVLDPTIGSLFQGEQSAVTNEAFDWVKMQLQEALGLVTDSFEQDTLAQAQVFMAEAQANQNQGGADIETLGLVIDTHFWTQIMYDGEPNPAWDLGQFDVGPLTTYATESTVLPGQTWVQAGADTLEGLAPSAQEILELGGLETQSLDTIIPMLLGLTNTCEDLKTAENEGAWVRNWQWALSQIVYLFAQRGLEDAQTMLGTDHALVQLLDEQVQEMTQHIGKVETDAFVQGLIGSECLLFSVHNRTITTGLDVPDACCGSFVQFALLDSQLPFPSNCIACGDGILSPGEACDDGKQQTGDGCDAACQAEVGWSCDSNGCTDINECAEADCGPGGTCSEAEGESNPGQYTCTCEPGHEGGSINTPCHASECAATVVFNSDYAASGSITGVTGDTVQVNCLTGWSGGGLWECLADGTWSGDACTANSCAPYQVANSNYSVSGSITATTLDNRLVRCDHGYSGTQTVTCQTTGTFETATCVQIDECTSGFDNCHSVAACTDTDGSFSCQCPSGYSGNGYVDTCNDTWSVMPTNGSACDDIPLGTGCAPCEAGTYEDNNSCVPCPAGSYCPTGAAAALPCPPGTTSQASAGACAPCGAGTYQDNNSCVPCPAGSYCPEGSADHTTCPTGSYCPQGASAALPCEAGYYCPDGAVAALPCPPGTTSQASAGSCAPCETGYTIVGTSCVQNGDTCAVALVIDPSALPFEVTGNNTGLGADYSGGVCGTSNGGTQPDEVYTFTPTVGGEYAISQPGYVNGSGPPLFYVTTDCEDILNTCVGGVDLSDSDVPEQQFGVELTAGTTYYIIVDSFDAADVGEYTLRVELANINECTDGTHNCDGNATCTDTENGYDCTCNPGFSGDGFACAPNPSGPCDSDPCLNGGVCTEGEFSVCQGASCEQLACLDAVCALDSFCCDHWDFNCANCAAGDPGMGGIDCSAAKEPCTSDFECKCPEDFGGLTCEEPVKKGCHADTVIGCNTFGKISPIIQHSIEGFFVEVEVQTDGAFVALNLYLDDTSIAPYDAVFYAAGDKECSPLEPQPVYSGDSGFFGTMFNTSSVIQIFVDAWTYSPGDKLPMTVEIMCM